MFTLSQHVGMYIISWLFWFIIIYFFGYLVQFRRGTLPDKKKLFVIANRVALACTLGTLIINVVLQRV
ncbi:MAG: hypothetical protein H6Q72_1087 [Firmicutes bacterium]|nr:hypothetical protein [Bacillota bacterium]